MSNLDNTIVLSDKDKDGTPVEEYVKLYATFSDELLKEIRERSMTVSTNVLYSAGIPATPVEVAQLAQMAFTSALLFAVKRGYVELMPTAIRPEAPEVTFTTAAGEGEFRASQYL